jgi:hypothetical protein
VSAEGDVEDAINSIRSLPLLSRETTVSWNLGSLVWFWLLFSSPRRMWGKAEGSMLKISRMNEDGWMRGEREKGDMISNGGEDQEGESQLQREDLLKTRTHRLTDGSKLKHAISFICFADSPFPLPSTTGEEHHLINFMTSLRKAGVFSTFRDILIGFPSIEIFRRTARARLTVVQPSARMFTHDDIRSGNVGMR